MSSQLVPQKIKEQDINATMKYGSDYINVTYEFVSAKTNLT